MKKIHAHTANDRSGLWLDGTQYLGLCQFRLPKDVKRAARKIRRLMGSCIGLEETPEGKMRWLTYEEKFLNSPLA
jgi:hypothetical protein